MEILLDFSYVCIILLIHLCLEDNMAKANGSLKNKFSIGQIVYVLHPSDANMLTTDTTRKAAINLSSVLEDIHFLKCKVIGICSVLVSEDAISYLEYSLAVQDEIVFNYGDGHILSVSEERIGKDEESAVECLAGIILPHISRLKREYDVKEGDERAERERAETDTNPSGQPGAGGISGISGGMT